MRRVTFLLAAASAVLGLAVAPTAASADAGGSAINYQVCNDFGDGYIMCFGAKGEVNNTVTPSGNSMFEENLTTTFTLNGPALTQTQSLDVHFHDLVTEGTLQELQQRNQFNSHLSFPGFSQTCVVSLAFHEINDGQQIQYDHSSIVCTSP